MTDVKLGNPPIVEAVVDLDCDMAPGWDLGSLESAALDAFRESYPKFRTQLLHEHTIQASRDAEPRLSVRRGLQAFQFLKDDERQLVQVGPAAIRSTGWRRTRLWTTTYPRSSGRGASS
jgi:uncharacterized protein (TIGR04255 family)